MPRLSEFKQNGSKIGQNESNKSKIYKRKINAVNQGNRI